MQVKLEEAFAFDLAQFHPKNEEEEHLQMLESLYKNGLESQWKTAFKSYRFLNVLRVCGSNFWF
jgi:hypothetical protein